MAKTQSWEVSDDLWEHVQPLVPKAPLRRARKRYQRRPGGGRKPMEDRQIFAGIVYVLRTGCQWKALPKSFGSASAVHKHFQRWRGEGFFLALWRAGLAEYGEMEGIAWEWQSIDGTQGKAPLAQEAVGNNPTDREKGSKRSLLVDGAGVPLSLIVSGANRHDVKLLAITLDSIVVVRPRASRRRRQTRVRTRAMQAVLPRKPCEHGVTHRMYAARGGSSRLPTGSARPPLGGRTHPLVVQPLPQALGAL